MTVKLDTIHRTTLLYRTGVEYGDYCLNHVQGCAHGCKYPCYAFLMAKRFGRVKTYEDWIRPAVVENALELLKNELPRLKAKMRSVHLCFTTDPFMYEYPEVNSLSVELIKTINSAGVPCTALTKGLLPIELSDLSPGNKYGITLIALDEDFRTRVEPGAAPYADRIRSLRELHDRGCTTWVSIEPYPTPNILDQDINRVLHEIGFVDKIIFGRTNYNAEISKYRDSKAFYNDLSLRVMQFCADRGIDCHIKEGTLTEKGSA